MIRRRSRRFSRKPPALEPDKMFWPGHVAPGLDPVVRADMVHDVCAERMARFDELPREVRDRINDKGVTR